MPDLLEAKLKEEQLFQLAVQYVITGAYLADVTEDKKRAVNRKAGTLVIGKGEVSLQRHRKKSNL